MSRVVTVMNMKGGVGKSTIAMHVAGALAIAKTFPRVLLIDYDPQFNLSQAFLPPTKYFQLDQQRKTSLAILQDGGLNLNPFEIQVAGRATPPSVSSLVHNVFQSKDYSLDLIPSTLDLMYVALGQSDSRTVVLETRFSLAIAEARRHYDLIVIDCHPAGSILTKSALQNSNYVLIPVAPSQFAIRGLGLMVDFVGKVERAGASIKPLVLFNLMSRSTAWPDEAAIRANPRFSKYCLGNTLKKYKAFSDPVGGTGFVWSGKNRKPYRHEAYRNLWAVASELATQLAPGAAS